MKIWSTIINLSTSGKRHTCYRVCRELTKKTNQTWMVKQKVASLDRMVYECYDVISSCKESNLVFFTYDKLDSNNGTKNELEYIISVCSVFNKKFIMISKNDDIDEFIRSKGGIILNQFLYKQIAEKIINLHSGGKD